jgi:hypothetical protein
VLAREDQPIADQELRGMPSYLDLGLDVANVAKAEMATEYFIFLYIYIYTYIYIYI